MSQILIFTDFEFTKRDFDRLGVQLMRDAGVEVFVADMSSIFYPKLKSNRSHVFEGYIEVKSYQQFREIIESSTKTETYCFVLMSLTFKSARFFQKIWRSPMKTVSLSLGALPISGIKNEKDFSKVFGYLFRPREGLRALEASFLNRMSKVFASPHEVGVRICAGKKVESAFSTEEKILSTGSLDFNIFLATPASHQEKHIVFLDENEPFHPDFDRLGVKKISPEKYYSDLNKFFRLLENRHGLPVVIAAHPSADLNTYFTHFEGRKVIKGETASLVRDSFGVLGHTSTAMQLAFLYNKPTCFFVTDEMTQGFREPVLKAYVDYGFHFYNVSLEEDMNKAALFYDEALAKKYINDFVISDGTPRVNTWERLIEYIKDAERN